MNFDDISELRRYFRREMFRIQAASMCQRVPVFETLHQTSELADTAIAACYRMAVEHIAALASARDSRLSTAPAAHGDRAGTAGHAGVRSGFGRGPGVRVAGRRSRGTRVLDSRGRAHCGFDHRLHRIGCHVHRGYAPTAQRERGRAVAIGSGLQGIFRQAAPRLGKASRT